MGVYWTKLKLASPLDFDIKSNRSTTFQLDQYHICAENTQSSTQ